MAETTGLIEGPGRGGKLPRGRHGIPRELVAANQRERLTDATAEIFAERGYASLVVSDVIARARVSRATFYQLFDDKQDCVLAAQRTAFDALQERLLAACALQSEWPAGVVAAVSVALDFASTFPGKARLVLASGYASSEPKLADQGIAAPARIVAMLNEGSQRCPTARPPSGLASQAAVGAAMSIVGTFLGAGETAALADLKPEIAQLVLTPYLGSSEAMRMALAT